MSVFQVVENRHDALPLAERAIFIEDRFSWAAFVLTPLWTLSHRMWVETGFWVVMALVTVLVGLFLGSEAGFALYAMACLYVGFDAANLRARACEKKGFRPAFFMVSPSLEQAEQEWIRRTTAQEVSA